MGVLAGGKTRFRDPQRPPLAAGTPIVGGTLGPAGILCLFLRGCAAGCAGSLRGLGACQEVRAGPASPGSGLGRGSRESPGSSSRRLPGGGAGLASSQPRGPPPACLRPLQLLHPASRPQAPRTPPPLCKPPFRCSPRLSSHPFLAPLPASPFIHPTPLPRAPSPSHLSPTLAWPSPFLHILPREPPQGRGRSWEPPQSRSAPPWRKVRRPLAHPLPQHTSDNQGPHSWQGAQGDPAPLPP